MAPRLLTARQVQVMLRVDRSTVYRMAVDGRLQAIKIGRQRRFPQNRLESLVHSADARPNEVPVSVSDRSRSPIEAGLSVQAVDAVTRTAAALLGVMMVVTDMTGRPLSPIIDPCPWLAERAGDPDLPGACSIEWQHFADAPDLAPRFGLGGHGCECARALIRSGTTLVGMVLAGGVAPDSSSRCDLRSLDGEGRRRVLSGLTRVAAVLSDTLSHPAPATRSRSGQRLA